MAPVSHLAGRYLLQQRVGGSGRSEVWRAWDEVLARTVAVRLVSVDRARPDFPGRFQEEVRAAAGVLHPNLVVIYDYGEAVGRRRTPTPYVITEFFEGESLEDRIGRGLPTPHETIPVFAQLAGALAAVHNARIVHCDLRPSNVLLTPGGVKLLGLGIAQVLREGAAIDAMSVYLAPEDLGTGSVAAPADVYAFGVMLSETLTGSRDPEAAMPAEVPAELADLCARCRATDPADRPVVAEVARILRTLTPDTNLFAETIVFSESEVFSMPGMPGMAGTAGTAAGAAAGMSGTAGMARDGERFAAAHDLPETTGPMPPVERGADGTFSGVWPSIDHLAGQGDARNTADAPGSQASGGRPAAAGRRRRRRRPGLPVLAAAVALAIAGFVVADRSPALFDLLGGSRTTGSGEVLAGPTQGGGTGGRGAADAPNGTPQQGGAYPLAPGTDGGTGNTSGTGDSGSGTGGTGSGADAQGQAGGDTAGGGAVPGPIAEATQPPDQQRTLAALARMRPLVQQGFTEGEIRSDVALDLDNVITNLQNDLLAGRTVDLERRVTELDQKITVRLQEGALTADRANVLNAALGGARPS